MKSRRSPPIPMQTLNSENQGKSRNAEDVKTSESFIPATEKDAQENFEEVGNLPPSKASAFTNGATKQGVLQLIAVGEIDRSPYQNRIINSHSEEFIADLAANITKEDLNSAILVRRKQNGRYELIAGEHRMEAFKRNGEAFIPAIVKTMDDIQAAKATVLDNVFRRQSSYYELFKGYKTLLDMKAFTSQAQLAKEVNISQMEMSRIMSFGKLPKEALEIISHRSELVPSNVALQLSEFVERYPDLVVKAVTKIIGGDLNPQRAHGWIQAQVDPKNKGIPRSITDTTGKTVYTMKGSGSNIQIKINDKDTFEDIEKAIFEFLEERARRDSTQGE